MEAAFFDRAALGALVRGCGDSSCCGIGAPARATGQLAFVGRGRWACFIFWTMADTRALVIVETVGTVVDLDVGISAGEFVGDDPVGIGEAALAGSSRGPERRRNRRRRFGYPGTSAAARGGRRGPRRGTGRQVRSGRRDPGRA